MGEENTFTGLGQKFFFCIKEDVGTEREQWHKANVDRLNIRAIKKSDLESRQGKEVKLDNIQVRKSTEVPERDTEKMKGKESEWPTSFTLSAEIEDSGQIGRLFQGMKKHQSGLRHYAHKTMSKSAKKALHRCHLHMKKCMFGRNRQ